MGEPRVLVVEDEATIRRHLVRALEREGMTVEQAEDGDRGWATFETGLHPVVVLDLRMPGLDGIEVLKRIQARRPETQVIILTGHGGRKEAIEAVNHHASAFLEKPADLGAVIDAVRFGWKVYQERTGLDDVPVGFEPPEPPQLQEVRSILAGVLKVDPEDR